VTSQRIIDGLAVTEAGAGPGVLWIHGYTMDSSVWEPLWQRLPGWRHVGLDLPWHGRSRPLRPGEDLDALAGAVTAVAAELAAEHVVAMSFGTVIGLQMAIQAPAAFASWTFAAPGLVGGPQDAAVEARYVELAMAYHRWGPGPHLTRLWMSSPPDVFRGVNARPWLRERLAEVIDRHRWTEMQDFGMRSLTDRVQQAERLGQVTAPVLVVVGTQEMPAHRACAEQIAVAAPGAALEVVDGAGHLALLEEPDAAAALVAAHLSSADAEGAGLSR
jgi:pimeloyl-ACP methyl ester carboxylesterase